MSNKRFPVSGAGFGYRRCMADTLKQLDPAKVDFLEVAPENWMKLGGRHGKSFRQYTEQFPFIAHGLSLSIGSPSPLDVNFVKDLKVFLDEHNIRAYSEHLSYCSDDGHLYDLMPIPFTEEAVKHTAARIRQVQDILERPVAFENVSFYAMPSHEMTELEFLLAVLEEADCKLLLDVNNIYVNSINHGYNANQFLESLPGERIMYIHIAGHYDEAEDLIVDTHGADVIEPVWKLLERTYQLYGVIPTLLERDFNIPPLEELMVEVDKVRHYQQKQEAANVRTVA